MVREFNQAGGKAVVSSEQSAVTGRIYYTGMGVYKRVALAAASGVVLDKDGKAASAEDVMDRFDQIDSFDGARTYSTSAEFAADVYRAVGWVPLDSDSSGKSDLKK